MLHSHTLLPPHSSRSPYKTARGNRNSQWQLVGSKEKAAVATICTSEISPAPTATSSKTQLANRLHSQITDICILLWSAPLPQLLRWSTEPQDHETWPGHVCASAKAFVRGIHNGLLAKPYRTPPPAFRVRKAERWSSVGNSPSAFRQKTFHFFFMPQRGEESRPGLPGNRQAVACSHGHRGGVWRAEVAEMKAMRKLCKEAGWWLKRERSWKSHSQTQAGMVSGDIRGMIH